MIFCQVIRIYRKRRVIHESDNRDRAERVFEQKRIKLRSGDLLLYVDGVQERALHAGYNRTRW